MYDEVKWGADGMKGNNRIVEIVGCDECVVVVVQRVQKRS